MISRTHNDVLGIPVMVLQSTRPPTVQPPTVTWDSLPGTYVLPDDPVENIQ